MIHPLLKKPSLDSMELGNYHPLSKFPFWARYSDVYWPSNNKDSWMRVIICTYFNMASGLVLRLKLPMSSWWMTLGGVWKGGMHHCWCSYIPQWLSVPSTICLVWRSYVWTVQSGSGSTCSSLTGSRRWYWETTALPFGLWDSTGLHLVSHAR